MQQFLNYYKATENLSQPQHRNFHRLYFLPARQVGEEEGNKETHTKEYRNVVPK